MKRKTLVLLLITGLCVATASAQFGVGIVYDPTNYSNALLRYYQLQQHLLQLRASYAQLVAQYNFAVRMAKNIQNMPARYRAQFSQWRNVSALNTYRNTGTWVNGINSGQLGCLLCYQVLDPLIGLEVPLDITDLSLVIDKLEGVTGEAVHVSVSLNKGK